MANTDPAARAESSQILHSATQVQRMSPWSTPGEKLPTLGATSESFKKSRTTKSSNQYEAHATMVISALVSTAATSLVFLILLQLCSLQVGNVLPPQLGRAYTNADML